MINRTFEGKKYRRTYIGGTKERESIKFAEVQGTKEDNSECDWLEYRRILTTYFDDTLHVMISWKLLLQKISFSVLILSVLFVKIPVILFTLIGISAISQLMYFIFKLREERSLKNYDMCLSLTLSEIERQTGFQLSK